MSCCAPSTRAGSVERFSRKSIERLLLAGCSRDAMVRIDLEFRIVFGVSAHVEMTSGARRFNSATTGRIFSAPGTYNAPAG